MAKAQLKILTIMALIPMILCSRLEASEVNLVRGEIFFKRQEFGKAQQEFRKYLRKNKKDYRAWNFLGASYYHGGEVKRALKTLKKLEKRVYLQSFNAYYQGLCYLVLEERNLARKYFVKSAKLQDEYSYRSMYELGVLDYKDEAYEDSAYWLSLYVRKYPRGPYTLESRRLLASLRNGDRVENIQTDERPNPDEALFANSSLSLFNLPHFWFVESGYKYTLTTYQKPSFGVEGHKLEADQYDVHAPVLNTGIALGPFKNDGAKAYFGYFYYQKWNTDAERGKEYLDTPTNFSVFPLRADVLERRHSLFTDVDKLFSQVFHFGLKAQYEIVKMGSSLISSSQNADIQKVIDVESSTLLLPRIGAWWGNFNHKSDLYLYFRKIINYENPDYSSKTYNFGTGKQLFISLGINHMSHFPEWGLKLGLDLYRFDALFNDPFLDYTRIGSLAAANYNIWADLYGDLTLGAYLDSYPTPLIRVKSCEFQSKVEKSAELKQCPREDNGLLAQLSLSWEIDEGEKLSASAAYFQNTNKTMIFFNESRIELSLRYAYAFPDVKRIEPYLFDFSDLAFRKEIK